MPDPATGFLTVFETTTSLCPATPATRADMDSNPPYVRYLNAERSWAPQVLLEFLIRLIGRRLADS